MDIPTPSDAVSPHLTASDPSTAAMLWTAATSVVLRGVTA